MTAAWRASPTACSPASIRIRATWIRVVCVTYKCRPAANSAGSASRSQWIVRDVIRVKSVRFHNEGDDVGYIRVTQFNEQTTEGLKKAISDLTSQLGSDKIKGFVIDLRNNPGGLLDQAISVSDVFLDKGEIVSTRGRNAEETQRFNAHAGDLTKGKPLIVLINGGSASASESSPVHCRTINARRSSARVRSAKARCRPSSRWVRTRAHCG